MAQAYSAPPFNITSGVTTAQGTAGRPVVDGAFIPRNAGTGSAYFSLNARLARSFRIAGRLVDEALAAVMVPSLAKAGRSDGILEASPLAGCSSAEGIEWMADAESMLETIQGFDPAGIAARDLRAEEGAAEPHEGGEQDDAEEARDGQLERPVAAALEAELGGVHVLIDYAHNPHGLELVGQFISKLDYPYKTGIITGTGDRRDEDIRELGAIAARYFNEIIIRVDKNLRGRTEDEIVELVRGGVAQTDRDKKITIIPDERTAIDHAYSQAPPNSLVFVMCDEVAGALEKINKLKESEEKGTDTGKLTDLHTISAK